LNGEQMIHFIGAIVLRNQAGFQAGFRNNPVTFSSEIVARRSAWAE
jgi:hypothetical protein